MIKNSPFYRSEENNQKTACKIDIFMSISKKVVSIKLHAKEGLAILSFLFIQLEKTSPRPGFSLRFAQWLWSFSRRISSVHLASSEIKHTSASNRHSVCLKQSLCSDKTELLLKQNAMSVFPLFLLS